MGGRNIVLGWLYLAIPSLNLWLCICDREQVNAYRAVPCHAEHRELFCSGFASVCTLSVLHDKMILLSLPNLSHSQIWNSGTEYFGKRVVDDFSHWCLNVLGFCLETKWMQCLLNWAFLRHLHGKLRASLIILLDLVLLVLGIVSSGPTRQVEN